MRGRYVALGSSFAAGPGIAPRVPGSPRAAMRSTRNYPHLVAETLGLDLVDVTYSGATTAHVLSDRQNGAPPQVSALDGTERLVTVTIGGNDVAYVPGMMVATLDRLLLGVPRRLPRVGPAIRDVLDPTTRERALARVAVSLRAVGRAVRERSPRARVVFVDYLTLLPKHGLAAPPLSSAHADLARHLAARLESLTAQAAAATGCDVVQAGEASRFHHAWCPPGDEAWTVAATPPLPGRPLAYHPNAAGMRAVAELVTAHLGWKPVAT